LKSYSSIINHRTLITMVISVIVPVLFYEFGVVYNVDLTLISIAIIFPLVFTIRGAFRRREKAMEHLSRFRSGLKIVHYLINDGNKLADAQKEEGNQLLDQLSNNFMDYLKSPHEDTQQIDQDLNDFYAYIQKNSEFLSGGTRQKIYRFLKDVHEGQENLIAIHTHRTPISLKAYCLIFIYIFPLIYTPTLINKMGADKSETEWITFFVVILSEFILISLYNIQDHMEHPFDDEGLDDIKLNNFKINR